MSEYERVKEEVEGTCNGCDRFYSCEDNFGLCGETKTIMKLIKQDFSWYYKRFPQIKRIRQSKGHGVTIVKLNNGTEARTKLLICDEWNSDLGIMYAYVKACEVAKGYFNGGLIGYNNCDDIGDMILSAKKINIKTTGSKRHLAETFAAKRNISIKGKSYYIADMLEECDCGIITTDLTFCMLPF